MGFVSKRGIFLPFRGKKGDIMNEIYFFLFQLILVAIVLLALFQFTNNVASNLAFEKRFISIDMGLLTTVINYVPGTLRTVYSPLPLDVRLEAVLKKNLVSITDLDVDLPPTLYWFLSNNYTKLTEDAVSLRSVPKDDFLMVPQLNFFKTGKSIYFDDSKVNPLQKVCPVLDTPKMGINNGVAIVKVLPDVKDYSIGDHPVNRIATSLENKYHDMFSQSNFEFKKVIETQKPICFTNVRTLPDLIIAIGDSGENREAGSLVIYFPVDSASLRSRKLACYLMNELLTPESEVLYAQIMPVNAISLVKESRLCVLKQRTIEEEPLTIFVDISKFNEDQINVDNVVEAIHSAVLRYYGESPAEVKGMTVSIIPPKLVTETIDGESLER